MDDVELSNAKTFNRKIFPFYKMISWDLLFYYAISFIFLTTEKNLNASQILLIDAIYAFFKFLLQIPLVPIIDKIGKRKSLILANVFVGIYMLLIACAINIEMVMIATFFGAIGFLIKGLCESNLLYDSIPHSKDRNKIFASIFGKGSSYFYYLEALTSCLAGFLFVFSPYLPIILAAIFAILSAFIASKFKEVAPIFLGKVTFGSGLKQYLRDLRQSFRFIFKSKRLRGLILFLGVFYGLLNLLVTLRKSLLYDIQIPVQYVGIIFAVLGVFSGIASSSQNFFHKRYKNRLLTVISIALVTTCIVSGLVVALPLSDSFTLLVVLASFMIQYFAKGLYFIFNKKYLNSFSTAELRTKIHSVNNLWEAICSTITVFACSKLLDITSTAYTFIIVGLVFLGLLTLILDYMKTRVGLKPEEYKRSDIPIPLK